MRCSRARRASLDRETSGLSPEASAALDAHLAVCAGCRERTRFEGRLTSGLARLRDGQAPAIDVTGRVRERVASLPLRRPGTPPARPLGWAVAAAAIFGAGLVFGFWRTAPTIERELTTVGSGLRVLVTGALHSLAPLASAIGTLLTNLTAAVEPLLRALLPAGATAAAAATALMAATISLVVVRDLLRARLAIEEHHR